MSDEEALAGAVLKADSLGEQGSCSISADQMLKNAGWITVDDIPEGAGLIDLVGDYDGKAPVQRGAWTVDVFQDGESVFGKTREERLANTCAAMDENGFTDLSGTMRDLILTLTKLYERLGKSFPEFGQVSFAYEFGERSFSFWGLEVNELLAEGVTDVSDN